MSVRKTDPITSKMGAESVAKRAPTHKQLLLAAYRRASQPLSDFEAARRAGLDRPGVCWWKRCSELRADGLIVPVATGKSGLTGEAVMVCEPADRC